MQWLLYFAARAEWASGEYIEIYSIKTVILKLIIQSSWPVTDFTQTNIVIMCVPMHNQAGALSIFRWMPGPDSWNGKSIQHGS